MPILHFLGEDFEIPFEPKNIAELIDRGLGVRPDPDTPPEKAELQGLLITRQLLSLWDAEILKKQQDKVIAPNLMSDLGYGNHIFWPDFSPQR
ncbi:MAG: hypothetical protein WCO89_02155 [Syntrophus sp. (in: bacteria)]